MDWPIAQSVIEMVNNQRILMRQGLSCDVRNCNLCLMTSLISVSIYLLRYLVVRIESHTKGETNPSDLNTGHMFIA